MKKRSFIRMLALILSFAMIAGCGSSKPSETSSEVEQAASDLEAITLDLGGLTELKELEGAEALSDEEYAEVDKAMRAYTGSSDSLLVNNAKSFYYYSQLSDESKKLYDTLLLVADDPESTDNIVTYYTTQDPTSAEYRTMMTTAYYAMLFDHPELFWLYKGGNTDIRYGSRVNGSGYDVYFGLKQPYTNYRTEVTAFNDAVNAFLKDINTNAQDHEIAREIHDKLISMVTYDYDVAGSNNNTDYAHSAFGALVRNSTGAGNTAVCDGYSLAYEYLLQQCGIEAAVILGKAGNNEEKAGGHAWNVVKLNGSWYEVDSTWDDPGSIRHSIDNANIDDASKNYYYEALDDQAYSTSVSHYLYNVTTSYITNTVPDSRYTYTSKDGKYRYSLVGSSVHIRADKAQMAVYKDFVAFAPEATGTEYANN